MPDLDIDNAQKELFAEGFTKEQVEIILDIYVESHGE